MERREFLGKLAKGTALATAFSVWSSGMAKIRSLDVDEHKVDVHQISGLMHQYGITDPDKGTDLYQEMESEEKRLSSVIVGYAATGALVASSARSVLNETEKIKAYKEDDFKVKFVKGVGRFAASNVLLHTASTQVHRDIDPLEKSNLINTEYLQARFGMSADNAEKFSDDMQQHYKHKIERAGLGTLVAQEIGRAMFGPIGGYPERPDDNSPNETTLDV